MTGRADFIGIPMWFSIGPIFQANDSNERSRPVARLVPRTRRAAGQRYGSIALFDSSVFLNDSGAFHALTCREV